MSFCLISARKVAIDGGESCSGSEEKLQWRIFGWEREEVGVSGIVIPESMKAHCSGYIYPWEEKMEGLDEVKRRAELARGPDISYREENDDSTKFR